MANFTVNWTRDRVRVWAPHLAHLVGRPASAIEIGTYEGRTANWLLANVLTHPDSRLLCIDPYQYSERSELKQEDLDAARIRCEENLAPFGSKVELRIARSVDVLPELPERTFDLIYVDGQHTAAGCSYDLVRSWLLLDVGGIAIVDDIDLTQFRRERIWAKDSPLTAATDFLELGLPAEVVWKEGNTMGIRKGCT